MTQNGITSSQRPTRSKTWWFSKKKKSKQVESKVASSVASLSDNKLMRDIEQIDHEIQEMQRKTIEEIRRRLIFADESEVDSGEDTHGYWSSSPIYDHYEEDDDNRVFDFNVMQESYSYESSMTTVQPSTKSCLDNYLNGHKSPEVDRIVDDIHCNKNPEFDAIVGNLESEISPGADAIVNNLHCYKGLGVDAIVERSKNPFVVSDKGSYADLWEDLRENKGVDCKSAPTYDLCESVKEFMDFSIIQPSSESLLDDDFMGTKVQRLMQ